MKKDAYYFSHDANSQDDPKCIMLVEQLGMEGYGIFWALVERLRCEKDYRLPYVILPALARRWNSSKEKIEAVVKNFGLFTSEDKFFFSERLNRSMIEFTDRRNKFIESGRKGGVASAKRRLSKPQPLKVKVKKSKEEGTPTPVKHPSLENLIDVGATIGVDKKNCEMFYLHFKSRDWINKDGKDILESLSFNLKKWANREGVFEKAIEKSIEDNKPKPFKIELKPEGR